MKALILGFVAYAKKLLFVYAVSLTALAITTSLAQAQRCPSGQDAFLNCLPADHRYGGPGVNSTTAPRAGNSRKTIAADVRDGAMRCG
jgi:hypothetical protein